MLGQELCDLEQLYKQGKLKEATNLQQRIVAPNACVSTVHARNYLSSMFDA